MRPLRFCMLTTFYPPASFGGDGVQVERLSRALADQGHSVTVIHSAEAHRALARRHAPAREGSPAGHAARADPRIRVLEMDARRGTLSPLAIHLSGRPLLLRRQLERALAEQFDVLHFHNPSLLGGPAVLGMGRGIKLYTAHEQWLVCPTHLLWKYQRRVCERPTCWRCCAVYGRPPQIWRSGDLLERSLAQLDALIVPSRTSAALHQRLAGSVRIEHLPHFVPDPPAAEPPAPAPPGEEAQRPYFLFVGRLEPIKGVDRLVELFRRPRAADLLVAGTGTIERSLRRRARELPHVRFLGRVGPGELDRLYRGALAVIVSTRGHESFGLVAVEAFARGTPAIVHRFGALAELIEASGAALGYRSEQELDDALDRIATDPGLARQLGARGRAAYIEHWTPRAHLDRYFALIAELARQRGDGPVAAAADAAGADPVAVS